QEEPPVLPDQLIQDDQGQRENSNYNPKHDALHRFLSARGEVRPLCGGNLLLAGRFVQLAVRRRFASRAEHARVDDSVPDGGTAQVAAPSSAVGGGGDAAADGRSWS